MSDDFDADGFDPFQDADEARQADAPLGLVVSLPARVIFDAKRELIFDELAAWEAAYRASGGKRVTFEEEADDDEARTG